MISQLTSPRLAPLRPDRRGDGRKRDVQRRARLRLGDGHGICRGPWRRDGARRRGEVDFGLGAHMACRARPRRVVAVR